MFFSSSHLTTYKYQTGRPAPTSGVAIQDPKEGADGGRPEEKRKTTQAVEILHPGRPGGNRSEGRRGVGQSYPAPQNLSSRWRHNVMGLRPGEVKEEDN